MFSKEQLSIGDWFIFWILMVIPLINIIVFLSIILSGNSNTTLRNMLLGQILLIAISIAIIIFVIGGFANLIDLLPFENLSAFFEILPF